MSLPKYEIIAPSVPGAEPTVQFTADTRSEAWRLARERFRDRRDLRWQDVRIECSGRLVEYAGWY